MIFLDHTALSDLVKKARSGDEEAFHKIYEHTADIQYHQILQMLGNPEDAQDVLQETYLLLFQHLDKIRSTRCLVAYLNRLSFYISKNFKKRSDRFHSRATDIAILDDMKADDVSLSDDVVARETKEDIREALNGLPEQERLIVTMHYYQNMTLQQAAYAMGVSLTTAKRIHRLAKQHLRARLERKGITTATLNGVAVMLGSYAKEHSLEHAPALKNGTPASYKPSAADLPAPPSRLSVSALGGMAIPASVLVGTVATAAAAFAKPASLSIDYVEVPTEYVAAPAKVTVHTSGLSSVDTAYMTSSSGKQISGKELEEGLFCFEVPKNGRYTVRVASSLGETASQSVEVGYIDGKQPDILKAEYHGLSMTVTFKEEESGMDESSIYCKSASGVVSLCTGYDAETKTASFTLPPEDHTLYFSDLAGNTGRAMFEYEEPR